MSEKTRVEILNVDKMRIASLSQSGLMSKEYVQSINDLKEAKADKAQTSMSETLEFSITPNSYINYKTGEISYYSGVYMNGKTFSRSDFIEVVGGSLLQISGLNFSGTYDDNKGLAFYDVDKNYISGIATALDEIDVAVPEDAVYCRISCTGQVTPLITSEVTVKSVVEKNKLTLKNIKESLLNVVSLDVSDNPFEVIRYDGGLLSTFLNVGCIGDSLCSGESYYVNTDGSYNGVDLYKHSWGQYLARMTGNKYYNFSKGGLTTRTWLASEYATQCFDTQYLCEAYIIGLGQNDCGTGLTLGTSSDINLDNYNDNSDTFYGNYAKIIQKIQEVQPKAKIFVMTNPLVKVETDGYNEAIRYLTTIFDNVYLIDLYTYGADIYNDTGLIKMCARQSHYNAIAYKIMAYMISSYIDWYMRKNLNEFLEIEFIGTEYHYSE